MGRRRFNTSERVALYLAAGGRCEECGEELEPGWHGDHVTPYSRGGPTDVVNGQALCPKCNAEKGASMGDGPHDWQNEALSLFRERTGDFLCVATPGAGKTRFALAGAQQLIDRGLIAQLIVIVPTSHLRKQWTSVAAKLFGIQLDPDFENRHGAPARDFDGVAVTYAAVANQPALYRHLAAQRPTLVILDEIHHAGDEEAWGKKIRHAFELATRRLLLSGTPFRTGGGKIPFVSYGPDDIAKPDVDYDYGKAQADGIVRPIAFAAFDGEARWRAAGEVTATRLSETDESTVSRALVTALDPDGEWILSVFAQAHGELIRQRETMPDAGGLVIAADQFKARQYAKMLSRISGEPVTLAISDMPDASARIADFTTGQSRWLVAVQMVSEGVDIPRLAVGVYASDYKTELFFRQVVGRFVRLRGPEDETCATLFIPSIQPVLGYATVIERMVIPALREAEERARRELKAAQPSLLLDLVEPAWESVGSSEATHYATILGGESLPDEELRRAEEVMRLAGMPASVTAAQTARALRVAGAGRVLGQAQVKMPAPFGLADQKKPLRKLVNSKVNKLARIRDVPHSHIHSELNKACGESSIAAATVDTLNRRLEILDRWLAET